MFNYLLIYRNTDSKTPLFGWRIYETLEEINDIKEYYKKEDKIELKSKDISVKYDDFNHLMKDVEILPITEQRASVLKDTFEGSSFGSFPIYII